MLAGKLLTQQVTVFAIVVLVLLGLPGNTLMFLTVKTSRRLRHKAYSHYLACLALFDNIVLVMHAIEETGRLLGYRSLQKHYDAASNLSALMGEFSSPAAAVGEQMDGYGGVQLEANSVASAAAAVTVPSTWEPASGDTEPPDEAFAQTLNYLSRFSPLQCKLWRYLELAASTLCPWFIACLSVERMVMIYMPFRRRVLCSQGTAVLVIGALVGTILVLTFPTAYFVTQQKSARSDYCQEVYDYSEEEKSSLLVHVLTFWRSRKWKLVVCVILLQFILPILVILVCNSLVLFRTYRMSTRSIYLQGAVHMRSMPTPQGPERLVPRARFLRAGAGSAQHCNSAAHGDTPTQEQRTLSPAERRPAAIGLLNRKSLKRLRSASVDIQSESPRHTQDTETELVVRRNGCPTPADERLKRVSLSQIYWSASRSVTYDASQKPMASSPDAILKPNASDSGVSPSGPPDAATTPNEMAAESHSLRAASEFGLRRVVLESSNSMNSLARTETTSFGSHSRRESPLTHFPIAEEESCSSTSAPPASPPPSAADLRSADADVDADAEADADRDGVVQVEVIAAGAEERQPTGTTLFGYASQSLAGLRIGMPLERVRSFFRQSRSPNPAAATTSPAALLEQNAGEQAPPRPEAVDLTWSKRDNGARLEKRGTLGNILDALPSSPETPDDNVGSQRAPPHLRPAAPELRLDHCCNSNSINNNSSKEQQAVPRNRIASMTRNLPPTNLPISSIVLSSGRAGGKADSLQTLHSATPNGNGGGGASGRSLHLHVIGPSGSLGTNASSASHSQVPLQPQSSGEENVVQRARRRVTQILLCITFSFVLLNAPMLCFYLASELRGDVVEDWFSASSSWIGWVELLASLGTLATAAINFFIYVIWGRNYREEMWSLLKNAVRRPSLARTGRNIFRAIHSSIRSVYFGAPPVPDAAAYKDRDRDRDREKGRELDRSARNKQKERSGQHGAGGTTINGCESCALRELAR